MQSQLSEIEQSISIRHAQVRVVQDYALGHGDSTAAVAVYGAVALHCSIDWAYPVHPYTAESLPPFDPSELLRDPVTRAAAAELGGGLVRDIARWVVDVWPHVCVSAPALVAVAEVLSVYRGCPPAQNAYRQAGREIAAEAGEGCTGIVWAGVCAEAKWMRMYGGRDIGDDATELAVDPVVAAARRELNWDSSSRVAIWVNSPATWARIDARAEEILAKPLIAATGEEEK